MTTMMVMMMMMTMVRDDDRDGADARSSLHRSCSEHFISDGVV